MKYLIGLIFCFILIFVVACDSKLGLENLSNFNFENQKSPFVQNILPSQYELEKFRDLEIFFSEPVFLGRKASKKFTIYKNKLRIKTKIFCSQISRESEELCESVLISQDSRNKEKDLKPGVYVLKIKSSVYNADGYPMLDAEGHKDDFEYFFKVKEEKDNLKFESKNIKNNLKIIAYDTWAKIESNNSEKKVIFREKNSDSSQNYMLAKKNMVEDLKVNTEYEALIIEPDLLKDLEAKQVFFKTQRVPKLLINEVMANPFVKSGDRESAAEFVEVYNFGKEKIDLENINLRVYKKNNMKHKDCELSGELLPKHYLVIGGQNFNENYYDIYEKSNILRLKGKTLCGSLNNKQSQKIELLDNLGRVLSLFESELRPEIDGRSIERVDSDANFCYSRATLGPTPGRKNGVSTRGCE